MDSSPSTPASSSMSSSSSAPLAPAAADLANDATGLAAAATGLANAAVLATAASGLNPAASVLAMGASGVLMMRFSCPATSAASGAPADAPAMPTSPCNTPTRFCNSAISVSNVSRRPFRGAIAVFELSSSSAATFRREASNGSAAAGTSFVAGRCAWIMAMPGLGPSSAGQEPAPPLQRGGTAPAMAAERTNTTATRNIAVIVDDVECNAITTG
mmetsp:Transcript_131722/g.294747  ORF Transcript_131722/g.294747 Transcript_131722/m.294747 type:complete len:215 (+) Transcript_131722:441-1085(+)